MYFGITNILKIIINTLLNMPLDLASILRPDIKIFIGRNKINP
jgi:hypothetical protein